MPKLEELTWPELREQLTYIAEARSNDTQEMRDRLFARALVELMDRSSVSLRREDLMERCPHCDGSGWIGDKPGGRGATHRTSCTCRDGRTLTAAGRAVLDVVNTWK
jgi:hypothetical protein